MTFSDALRAAAARRGLELPPPAHPEPLAALDYVQETALKADALAEFWRQVRLPGAPEPLVPAPSPRGYRTTSKRRAHTAGRGVELGFPGLAAPRRGPAASALDGVGHREVYAFLFDWLTGGPARALATVLQWAIVRGTGPRLALILNVRALDARIVRAAKHLAAEMPRAVPAVQAAFLYVDPAGSEYYLEARRPEGTLAFKRLFGSESLAVNVDDTRLRFPVTVFSQVNGAMLATLVESARNLLSPTGSTVLLDLYCGYGLFSLTLGRTAQRVVGVDYDGPAIDAARRNADELGQADRVRFVPGRIDAEFLANRLRRPAAAEVMLLDPPRQGTAPGVIGVLAARAPERVLQISCGIDELPREVAAWAEAGYRVQRAQPLDLFAGTTAIEVLVLLGR